jgi:Fur family transcriptional regulator, ferric uptake regulator
MKFTKNKIIGMLRQRGYKLTPQRRQVINAIMVNHEHLTPAALYEMVHRNYPGVGRVTIYRTLDILASLGLICEVHTGGSCHSYLLRGESKHHHHLLCSECGIVVNFDNCELDELTRILANKTGFTIKGHLLEFSGLCPDCQRTHAV